MSHKIDNTLQPAPVQALGTAPVPRGEPGDIDQLAHRFETLMQEGAPPMGDAPQGRSPLQAFGAPGAPQGMQPGAQRDMQQGVQEGAQQPPPGEGLGGPDAGPAFPPGSWASIDPRILSAQRNFKLRQLQHQHEVKLQAQAQADRTEAQAVSPLVQQPAPSPNQASLGGLPAMGRVDAIARAGETGIAPSLFPGSGAPGSASPSPDPAVQPGTTPEAPELQDLQTMQVNEAASRELAQEVVEAQDARDPSAGSSPARHEQRRQESQRQESVAGEVAAAQVVQAQLLQQRNTPDSLPLELLNAI